MSASFRGRSAIGQTLLAASAAVTLGACEATPVDARKPSPPAVTPVEQASAILDRPRAPGEDDGLEVVRWSVADNEPLLRRTLARYALRDVALGTTTEALERHGLRAAVIPEADLSKFLIDVGGTSKALTVWFGQVPSWREAARTMFDSPRVAMIDGRAERLHAGWLRFMVRSWTVPLEEGAVLDLQVAPQLVADASDTSGILNRDVLRGTLWPEASIHAELPRNTALVLLSAPARREEDEADPEGPPRTKPSASGTGAGSGLGSGAGSGWGGGVGPAVELPPTLGEFLLTDLEATPHRRLLLVLRARLPDILFADPVTPLPAEPGLRDGGSAAPTDPPADAPPADAP